MRVPQGETLRTGGICIRSYQGKTLAYRMSENPDRDAIDITDISRNDLKGMTAKHIHRSVKMRLKDFWKFAEAKSFLFRK